MGRPLKGNQKKVQLSGKVDPDIYNKVSDMADLIHGGNITAMMEELVSIGLEKFSTDNKDRIKLLRDFHNVREPENFKLASNDPKGGRHR